MHKVDISDPRSRIISNILREQALHVGDEPFLVDSSATWTYGQVDDMANRHARAYADLGIGRGDTVAMLMHNSADMALTSFGVNRLGAVWSAINTEYRGHWLGQLLDGVDSKVLVVDADLWHNVAGLPDEDKRFEHVIVRGDRSLVVDVPSGVQVHEFGSLGACSPLDSVVDDLHHGDTTGILWTSGTTGRSKGVMQSNNVWATFSKLLDNKFRDGGSDDEVYYSCLPMSSSGGWYLNVYPAMLNGRPACIDKRFSVTDFWDRIRHYKATTTILLGTMQLYVYNQPAKEDDADNTLRTLVMVPIITDMLEPFMKRFGIDKVGCGWGQSEVMGATVYRSDWPLDPGSVGYATDDLPVETKLLDDDDREVAAGEIGEFCVRPREPFTIFNGYYKEPEKTLAQFRNLWYHTGDLGRRNEDGQMFFSDRKKDSTRHKGRNISSFEVESIARRHPDVADVAAVGVTLPELSLEEELMLYVQPVSGRTVDPFELCKFIDSNAPYFFVPRYVESIAALPLNPQNKVLKYQLRERGVTLETWDRAKEEPEWAPTR